MTDQVVHLTLPLWESVSGANSGGLLWVELYWWVPPVLARCSPIWRRRVWTCACAGGALASLA